MAATYEPISSTTLGSSAATVLLSSIPSTYTDLVLITSARATTGNNSIFVQLNSDTANNYSGTQVFGNGSSAGSQRFSSLSSFYTSLVTSATDTFAPGRVHFMSYANTNVYKTVLAEAADSSQQVARRVCLWRSTAAISSITLFPGGAGNNFLSGSTFSLYGIKAA